MNIPKPGDIYFADLDSGDRRRIIVMSREELNRGKYVVAIPVTTRKFEERARCFNCVPFRANQYGFACNCVAQCELITFLSKDLVNLNAGPLATLAPQDMRAMVRAVGYAIEADCELGIVS